MAGKGKIIKSLLALMKGMEDSNEAVEKNPSLISSTQKDPPSFKASLDKGLASSTGKEKNLQALMRGKGKLTSFACEVEKSFENVLTFSATSGKFEMMRNSDSSSHEDSSSDEGEPKSKPKGRVNKWKPTETNALDDGVYKYWEFRCSQYKFYGTIKRDKDLGPILESRTIEAMPTKYRKWIAEGYHTPLTEREKREKVPPTRVPPAAEREKAQRVYEAFKVLVDMFVDKFVEKSPLLGRTKGD
ncbi:hypothetical protein TSUD_316540 [Trifolium subterraneum]|uniref:Uncharacterized protein n=1 Tax=Trifolium subterraneum TaxID=3900 RepID=A0A2Z6MVE7_TRISU|nr:hypothetical protein TSUD_316540 [Trifolium subterraneum]